jgi:hypothetical protein
MATDRLHRRRSPLVVALCLSLVLVGLTINVPWASAADGPPVGNLERVRGGEDSIRVTGWAFDADADGPGYVWVTIDGVGRHLRTDEPRPDVAAAYADAPAATGFRAELAATAGRHTVCVTAANVGPGTHQELGCRTVYVLPVATPIGSLVSVREVTGGIALSGWAIDPDTTDAVYVWVTVDGVGRHLRADLRRSDLGTMYPDYGARHAFSATLPASRGTHTVCVTVSNVGPGSHRSLGCRTVGQVSVAEAQRILTGLGIPAGPVDGAWGARTAQGMCTFRHVAGLPVSRGPITAQDSEKLRAFDAAYASLSSVPAPSRGGRSTYLVANLPCQTMLYASGGHYVRVFPISSGRTDYETPTGRFYLGATSPGWSCSTLFPEACHDRPQGMNSQVPEEGVRFSTYGNMYNKRSFLGSFMLHGSGFVPTYAASHGCIRVSIRDSDWMYRNLTNAGGRILFDVVGRY